MSDIERLIAERDEARANAERLWTTLAEQDNELEAAREDVLRLTSERDTARAEFERLTAERDMARAEVRRLIAERDQPESRPKGREVGRFGWDGHYLDYEAMKPTRPTDEDIWREAFMNLLIKMNDDLARLEADRALTTYRKRWPR